MNLPKYLLTIHGHIIINNNYDFSSFPALQNLSFFDVFDPILSTIEQKGLWIIVYSEDLLQIHHLGQPSFLVK